MESLEALPVPLGEIEIPTCLSVTKLVTAGPCLLRVVAPPGAVPPVPGSPRAEFGNLAHVLSDLAVKGGLGVDGVPADIPEAFEYLLEQVKTKLASSQETRRYADLRVGFTKREWERRRYFAVARAEQEAEKRGKTGAHRRHRSHGLRPLSLREVIERRLESAVEVPFVSTTLRIRGRIDLVDSEQFGGVMVSDFKSGVVTDVKGELNVETSLQLRLYGLAVGELTQSRIALRVLGQNHEYSVPFDETERQSTARWLQEKTERLPPGNKYDAGALAVIGPRCVGCRLRPVCPAYRRFVGEAWKRPDNRFKLPLDIAGTVTGRGEDGEFVWLKLRDLAGRTAKIHRLHPETAPPSLAGQQVWFFDLASIEARKVGCGWRHPWNFHQVAATPTDRTAWTLRVFVQNSRT
jgi:RecB family exonuclease